MTDTSAAAPLALIPRTTEKGQQFIMQFEGCALRAYRDVVGVWTIGFGQTNYDKTLGFKVGPGVTITYEEALRLFRNSIARQYEPEVAKAMPNAAPNVFDTGTSFHFNTGAIGRASWVKAALRGDWAAVKASLMSWNRAGGKVVAGLTRRRAAEFEIAAHNNYGKLTPPVMLDANGRVTRNPVPGPAMLFKGASGPEVKTLQNDLIALDYFHGEQSGTFDDELTASVEEYQRNHPQLKVDGIVGPATRAAITRDADMKRKLKNVSVTGTVSTAAPAVAQATSAHSHILNYALIGIGALFAVALIYVAWKYRDELMRVANKISGGGNENDSETN